VSEFLKRDLNFKRCLKILEEFMEEEVVANSSKMVRLVLRDEANFDRVVVQYPRLGDFILQLMKQHNYSAAVNQECAAALRNYTRKPNYVNNLNAQELGTLVNATRNPKFDKLKFLCLQAIRNISKSPEHERYLKQIGASDLIMTAQVASAKK